MLRFPDFQSRVIAALGLDNLISVRVYIALDRPWRTWPLTSINLASHCNLRTRSSLRIKNADDVSQRHAVLAEQLAQFVFKFQLLLQCGAAFEDFEGLQLLGDLAFQGSVFGCL